MKSPPTASERKALLLNDPDVATWIKGRPRVGTGITQLDHLRIFLDRTGLDVRGFVELSKKDGRKFRNVVLDFVHEEQGRRLKAKYIVNIWWSVRSFLRSVDAAPNWNPPVEDTEADEGGGRVVPSSTQVREIAHAVKSVRDRMVVLVLASSGVRIGTFGSQNGEADGLRIKNLIDLDLSPEPHFVKSPPMIRVPAHLSKGKAGYYSGLTPEAAEAVIATLIERKKRGENLTPDSPLVVPDGRGTREARRSKDGQTFLVRKSLAARVQAAMDAVAPGEIRWTPHSLRAYTSTQLEAAEAKGLVSKTRREYFLGHALGSMDSIYNLGRALSPEKVEELRAAYKRCEPLLSTAGGKPNDGDGDRLFRLYLKSRGVPDEALKNADLRGMSDAEVMALFEKIGAALTPTTPAPAEKAVPNGEAPGLLASGWTLAGNLGLKMVVLRAPQAPTGAPVPVLSVQASG